MSVFEIFVHGDENGMSIVNICVCLVFHFVMSSSSSLACTWRERGRVVVAVKNLQCGISRCSWLHCHHLLLSSSPWMTAIWICQPEELYFYLAIYIKTNQLSEVPRKAVENKQGILSHWLKILKFTPKCDLMFVLIQDYLLWLYGHQRESNWFACIPFPLYRKRKKLEEERRGMSVCVCEWKRKKVWSSSSFVFFFLSSYFISMISSSE